MAVQQYPYWFVYWINPANGKPVIWKTDFRMEHEAEAWARNYLTPKNIKFGIKGANSVSNDVYQNIKAEAVKLSGDINWASRSSHVTPVPEDIIENSEN